MKAGVQEKVMKKKVVRKLKNASAADVGGVNQRNFSSFKCMYNITVIKTLKYKTDLKKKSKTMTPIKILIKNSHLTMDSIVLMFPFIRKKQPELMQNAQQDQLVKYVYLSVNRILIQSDWR